MPDYREYLFLELYQYQITESDCFGSCNNTRLQRVAAVLGAIPIPDYRE